MILPCARDLILEDMTFLTRSLRGDAVTNHDEDRALRERKRTRRRARRSRRHERAQSSSNLQSALTTTTAFAFAGVLIATVRSVVLKIDPTMMVSLIEIFMAGMLLTGFGLMCMWSAYGDPARRKWVFALVGATLFAVGVWSVGPLRTISEPTRAALTHRSYNPDGARLPRLACGEQTLGPPEDQHLSSITPEYTTFDGELTRHTDELVDIARGSARRHRREAELLHRRADLVTYISADRCVDARQVHEHIIALQGSDSWRIKYNVYGPVLEGNTWLPRASPEAPDTQLVIVLGREDTHRDTAHVLIGGERVAAFDASLTHHPDPYPCRPGWDRALGAWLDDNLPELVDSLDLTTYSVVAAPDIPLQHIVTLHEQMNATSACERRPVIMGGTLHLAP